MFKPLFCNSCHRFQAVEARHGIIREDDVRAIFQFGQKIPFGLHAFTLRGVPGGLQCGHQQIRVVGRVFDDQNFQGNRHGVGGCGIGMPRVKTEPGGIPRPVGDEYPLVKWANPVCRRSSVSVFMWSLSPLD